MTTTTTTLYRGERAGLHEIAVGGTFPAGDWIWFADDVAGARGYLRGRGGTVYTALVPSDQLAGEWDIARAAREAGSDADEYEWFELLEGVEGAVDGDAVVDALTAAGFVGATYRETDPLGNWITTTVVFDGSAARVVEIEES